MTPTDVKTVTWDVWFHRENVGWWLEEELADSLGEAARIVSAFFVQNPDYNVHKFAFMILPSGKKPSDFAPRFTLQK